MEPTSTGLLGALGLGFQILGATQAAGAARTNNAYATANYGLERQVDNAHRQLFEMQNRRQSLEDLRNAQRARSVSLANATSQGASFGSGYAGGQAQIKGQSNYNQQGLFQNLQIGENIFDLNAQISANRLAMSRNNMELQKSQGLTQLGGSLVNAAGNFGKLSSGWGPSSGPNSGFQNYGTYLGSSSANAIS